MKQEFSKTLLIQESALIWVITISFIILAYIAIINGYAGTLPWLAAFPTISWGAYAVSQTMYYKKSMIENQVDGIKYETVMAELKAKLRDRSEPENNFEMPENPPVAADTSPDPFGPM